MMDVIRSEEGQGSSLDLEDPQLEEKLVNELKAQGVFDQFRKDCLSDVDTKPAYQNLRVRVDKSVSSYLSKTTWRPTLNKNQLRNQLRKYIQDQGVEAGVDRIVDQIVNPKLNTSFMPEVENVIYKYFGTTKPEAGDLVNGDLDEEEEELEQTNGESPRVNGHEPNASSGPVIHGIRRSQDFSPGPLGHVSPLTPSGSPKVNAGDISPLTPSTTPPPVLPLGEEQMDIVAPDTTPPPPGEEIMKIEEVSTVEAMEVDTEEMQRPKSAYTPPLPHYNSKMSTPEKSFTPPLPQVPSPGVTLPLSPSNTPPPPPLPEDDSGGEASMSSISDTDLGDVPTPPSYREHDDSDEVDKPETSEVSNNGEDEDLQQLEKMKAELMAQLDEDFKLSPEESESDGEEGELESEVTAKDSPTSPDQSSLHSSRSITPSVAQHKHVSPTSSSNSSPNQLQRLRTLPLPTPDYSQLTSSERISTMPLPPEESRSRSQSGESKIDGPRTPRRLQTSQNRYSSESPSPPPPREGRQPSPPPEQISGPKTPPSPGSPPSAFSSRLSHLALTDPPPSCKPFDLDRGGSRSPPDQGDGKGRKFGSEQSSTGQHIQSSSVGTSSTTIPPKNVDGSNQRTVTPSSSTMKSNSKFNKGEKVEKKSVKIKQENKAKIEKINQQIKSKDKLKSDKYSDLDIFSTTKKPITPFQRHRLPNSNPTSAPGTPVSSKKEDKPNEFTRKLSDSLNKLDKKDDKERKDEKKDDKHISKDTSEFKKPAKIDDRRRSSSSKEDRKEVKDDKKVVSKEIKREPSRNAKLNLSRESPREVKQDKNDRKSSSKDDKRDMNKSKERSREEKDKRERTSSEKERRSSEDEKKEKSPDDDKKERRISVDKRESSKEKDLGKEVSKEDKYEKEREKQLLESKRRLQEIREKKEREDKEKEREEKERKRLREKEKKEREKKIKELEELKKIKERKERDKEQRLKAEEAKNSLKEKISLLGSDAIQKMLVETLAEKKGTSITEHEEKEMMKKLEEVIVKKSPMKVKSKQVQPPKITTQRGGYISAESSSSSSDSSSDSDSSEDGSSKLNMLRNRIQNRRKSNESSSNISPQKNTRSTEKNAKEKVRVEAKEIKKDISTSAKKDEKLNKKSLIALKVKSPVKNETKEEVKVSSSKPDVDPSISDFHSFKQEDIQFMLEIKDKYHSLLKQEDNISVSSITSSEITRALPPTRTIVIDAGQSPQKTVTQLAKFGGNPRLFTPVPEWLHPYLSAVKLRVDDLEMPSHMEVAQHLAKKQCKAKKRGGGYDIVVEWVPNAPPSSKKTRLEKELGFDNDSSFGMTVANSGGKRRRRANKRYSEEFTSECETPQEQMEDSLYEGMLEVVPNGPSQTVRTHEGPGIQTPARGVRWNPELGELNTEVSEIKNHVTGIRRKRESGNKEESSDKTTLSNNIVKIAENFVEDKTLPVIPSEESGTVKKRRSKDRIAAYLKSAGVERVESNQPPIKDCLSPATQESSNKMAVTVAILDAEISAADEELNSVIKSLRGKRKRASSSDTKFHGWAAPPVMPKTGYSLLVRQEEDILTLDMNGATFGLTSLDLELGLEEDQENNLMMGVVMSPPILMDVKKVEKTVSNRVATPSNLNVKPGQDSSDGDDRGSHSPSSFGSAKENVPQIYNKVVSIKSSRKAVSVQKRRRSLKNPVLKTNAV